MSVIRASLSPRLLLAAAVAVFLVHDSQPAKAQTVIILVSNIGQTATSGLNTHSEVLAQGFTTGIATGSYMLSSIEAVMNAANATQAATVRVELWPAAAGRTRRS